MIQIPEYDDACRRVKEGNADPLDHFIYHNEPAGEDQEKLFRMQLTALVTFIENKQ